MSPSKNPVIHVITTIDRGGAERQLLTLCRYQVSNGSKVTVVPLKGNDHLREEFYLCGVSLDYSLFGQNPVAQIFLLRRLIKKSDESILHSHLPRAEILSSIASFFTNSKRIISKHNSEPFLPKGPALISRFLARFVFFRTHKVVCISNYVKSFLASINEIPTDSNKVHIIHYGFEWASNVQNLVGQTELRMKGEPSLTIGTVSRLTPQKDLFTLLDGLKIILEQNPRARLKVVGVGELEVDLREYAEKVGVSKAIDWLGSQSHPYKAIGRADVYALSSRYEGFGLVILEWINENMPIVASRIPPLEEILGIDYPYFCEVGNPQDFADKIIKINSAKSPFNQSERYKRIQKEFDFQQMGARMSQVYQGLLAKTN